MTALAPSLRHGQAVACGVLMLAAVTLLVVLDNQPWRPFWEALGVIPAAEPIFGDLRTIFAANASLAQGFNPLLHNPGDIWGRPYNYPRLWLNIGEMFGNDPQAPVALGVFLGLLSLLAWCGLVLAARNGLGVLAVLSVVPSVASLLAIERGNTDQAAFFLVVAAALVRWRSLSTALLYLAALLKIFPALALLTRWRPWRREALLTSALVLALLAFSLWPDFLVASQNTLVSGKMSYGFMSLRKAFGAETGWIFLLIYGLVAAAAFHWLPVAADDFDDSPASHAFLAGALIFCASYWLGANWAYRMLFLAATLPWLLSLAPASPGRWVYRGLWPLILIAMYSPGWSPARMWLTHGATVLLCAVLSALLLRAFLPDFRRLFGVPVAAP